MSKQNPTIYSFSYLLTDLFILAALSPTIRRCQHSIF